jgi:DNA polymerase-3 subunit gamma/tau
VSSEPQPAEQERSLYRRHRPRTFAEVVGQEPVVRTLKHAVERDKVHHAYLFVGSRGTGKTSMAKILAACLNCENGPTTEPCGRCESCLSIARANSLDVIEMDAASNNSVDDIRELRESVAFAPVSGRRKIYILDEAHMLSTAAWNAFLKTLEEPPPNTVFVLATTEANKVPATVVDRCHRFDFHRPTVEQIASVLRRTAEAESIEIPPPAVAAVARAATGSFRDALGTLEQLVTYSGPQVALEDVLAVLGVAESRLLSEVVDAVAAGDGKRALTALAECVEQGRDAGAFAGDLEVHVRELLIVQMLGEVPAELSLTPEADAALAQQAEQVDHAIVVRLLELLGEAMEAVRAGADARTRLELALVKAARPEVDGSMRALLARIERLEAGRVPVSAQREVEIGGLSGPSLTGEAAVEQTHEQAAPVAPDPDPASPAPASPVEDGPTTGSLMGEAAVAVPPAREETAPESGQAPAESVQAPPAAATALAEPVAGTLEALRSVWPAVVDLVRSEHALLGALIAESQPVELQEQDLTLAFSSPFKKKKAEDPANRMTVGEALRVVTGSRWRISYELREDLQHETAGAPVEHSEERWLARFMEEFDAEEIGEGSEGGGENGSQQDTQDGQSLTSNEKGS